MLCEFASGSNAPNGVKTLRLTRSYMLESENERTERCEESKRSLTRRNYRSFCKAYQNLRPSVMVLNKTRPRQCVTEYRTQKLSMATVPPDYIFITIGAIDRLGNIPPLCWMTLSSAPFAPPPLMVEVPDSCLIVIASCSCS